MPLTPKGRKIMKAMRKQYGKKEGESVFYASKNKGTIEGVDEAMNDKGITRSQAMKDHAHGSFGPKRGVKKKKGAKPKKINLATIVSRTKSPEGKRARAKETMKRNLMAHTVYHDMGYLMAESLGLVSEGEVKRKNKAKKNKNYARANFPEGQASDDVTPAYNPHGTSEHGPGHMRGKKKRRTVAEARDLDRARDAGAPKKGTPFKRGGDRSDSVDRARKAYEAKVKRQSQNMIGADEEPSGAKKFRQARERGGTKERVSAGQGVKTIMRGKKPKLKIKPSTKKKVMEKPKAPKYK